LLPKKSRGKEVFVKNSVICIVICTKHKIQVVIMTSVLQALLLGKAPYWKNTTALYRARVKTIKLRTSDCHP